MAEEFIEPARAGPRPWARTVFALQTALTAVVALWVLARRAPEELKAAVSNLGPIGFGNGLVSGPLNKGWPAAGPYDVIIIEGAVEVLPDTLSGQLKEGGRLVAIVGAGRTGQGTVFRKTAKGLSGFPIFDAAAPVLPGFAKAAAFVF